MSAIPPSTEQKRSVALGVGRVLVRTHGRRKSYAPEKITAAMRLIGHPQDWDSWALSLYASLYDFIQYYAARDETRDYEALRISMMLSLGIPVQTLCNPPAVPRLPDSPLMPESIGPQESGKAKGWTVIEIVMDML